MKSFLIDEFVGRLGETAEENWQLLSEARQNHTFFHLSSFPSGYVIVDTDYLSPKQVAEISTVLKENTKYRNIHNIKVDYTLVSNVRKGTKVGEALYVSSKKVRSVII